MHFLHVHIYDSVMMCRFFFIVGVQGTFSVSVEIPDHDVDYLIDSASLIRMPNDVNWRTTANSEIDRLRKATLTLT